MLGYKKRVQRLFNFEVGTKLVCVNTFGRESEMRKDLIPGPKYSQTWNVVYPVIAEMVSSDFEKIEQRKKGKTRIFSWGDQKEDTVSIEQP